VGPNGVRRDTYDFKVHKNDILATLNELGKSVMDLGLTPVLHQHTGTCVESRDETYAVMEAVDTKAMKFGPDIGQLQKGGSDPVKVVKDFLPLVQHMVELDSPPPQPVPAIENARIAKSYLEKAGIAFRAGASQDENMPCLHGGAWLAPVHHR
jgi:inosose dehydratase